MPEYANFGLGRRWNGAFDVNGQPNMTGDYKGPGFASMLVPENYGIGFSPVTEYSAGGGNTGLHYPLVYQGIMPWEMQTIANDIAYPGSDPAIADVAHGAYLQAIVRIGQGLPAFWQPQDGYTGLNFTPYNR